MVTISGLLQYTVALSILILEGCIFMSEYSLRRLVKNKSQMNEPTNKQTFSF